MKYVSICSGICAPTAAWKPLGWEPMAFSEIEPFPSSVLKHHYPNVPNHGDFTAFDWSIYRGKVDLVVAGTPCQAFSVAGHRKSLDDARGNLTLEFLNVIDAIRPRYVVWENVPGVLSTGDNAFGCFLGELVGGDDPVVFERGWPSAGVVDGPIRSACWRLLDAQYFGLAQRRKRVFVISSSRGERHPAEILFEWESLRRDYPPSREAGEGVAEAVDDGALFDLELSNQGSGGNVGFHDGNRPFRTLGTGGGPGVAQIVGAMPHQAHGGIDTQSALNGYIAPTLTSNGDANSGFRDEHGLIAFDTTQITSPYDRSNPQPGDPCHTLAKGAHAPAVVGWCGDATPKASDDCMPTMRREQGGEGYGVSQGMAVRRLLPIECERLQGFPDDFTKIPGAKDGPRYKALGNSMAVPVLRWIAERITL